MSSQVKKTNSYLKIVRQDIEELRKKMIEYQKEQQTNSPSNRPRTYPGGAFSAEKA